MSKPLRVLFIEDQAEDCCMLVSELEKAGYELIWKRVDTMPALTEALEKGRWDLILSDYAMPDFSGLVALGVFKKTELEIPFIFVSGVMGESTAVKAMKMGASDYVMKGNLKRLVPAVERELRDYAIRSKEKQAEKALVESNRRWKELFENIRDGWVATELDGRFTECNKAFELMLGYSLSELQNLTYERITPEKWHGAEQEIVRNKILRHGYSGVYEKEYIRSDGTVFPVELSSYLRKDEKGSPIGFWAIARDITQRKKMENELRESVEKAEAVSHLKSSLLLNISHELRTPMNGILGFAAFLKERQTDPENIEMADYIVSSGKRLMATLNSILDLAALESDRTLLEMTDINLSAVINELILNFQDLARKKNISLIPCAENDLHLTLDISLLRNTIHHLFDNALKFTSSGRVSATVERELYKGKEYAAIRINDTGIGITEPHLKLIFEPFRQASEGLGRKFEGSGLGLTLCKQFTELMDGEIDVESKPGEGSSFVLRFPLPVAHPKSIGRKTAEAAGLMTWPEEMPYVLIVEDNPLNSDLTARFIEDVAHVEKAADGYEALKFAMTRVYDAVLMDIHLSSEMDGLLVTEEMRKLAGYAAIPIIAITGYSTAKEKERILSAGLTHYIAKPFDKVSLRNLLRTALAETHIQNIPLSRITDSEKSRKKPLS
jgi:PAS domain S-box-containing protein